MSMLTAPTTHINTVSELVYSTDWGTDGDLEFIDGEHVWVPNVCLNCGVQHIASYEECVEAEDQSILDRFYEAANGFYDERPVTYVGKGYDGFWGDDDRCPDPNCEVCS